MLGVRPPPGACSRRRKRGAGGPAVVLVSDGLLDARVRARSVHHRTDDRLDDRRVHGHRRHANAAPTSASFRFSRPPITRRAFADRGARATVDVWLPMQATPESLPRSTHPIFMVARLKASVETAQEELGGDLRRPRARISQRTAARGVFVEPLSSRGVWSGPSGAPGVARRRRPGAPRRVRQRRQPAARARYARGGARSPSAPRSGERLDG